ncbi:MAG: PLDc_N domain-containing protein [Planctomycetales bacterium]|nr:PLDc_N domain-containing protein [Planctomycetales bacterium]
MLIAAIVFFCLSLVAALFFAILHPFLCVAVCAMSKNASGGQKILWIVLSLFFGLFGSIPYALFATDSIRLRTVTKRGLSIGLLCFLATTLIAFMSPDVNNYATGLLSGVDQAIGEAAIEGEFQGSLDELQEPAGAASSVTEQQEFLATENTIGEPVQFVSRDNDVTPESSEDSAALLDDYPSSASLPAEEHDLYDAAPGQGLAQTDSLDLLHDGISSTESFDHELTEEPEMVRAEGELKKHQPIQENTASSSMDELTAAFEAFSDLTEHSMDWTETADEPLVNSQATDTDKTKGFANSQPNHTPPRPIATTSGSPASTEANPKTRNKKAVFNRYTNGQSYSENYSKPAPGVNRYTAEYAN